MIATTESKQADTLATVASEIKKDDEPRVSEKWVKMFVDRLAELGIDQKDISAATGAPQTQISRLKTQGKWTRYINAIADFVNLPHPYVLVSSPEEDQWIEIGRRMMSLDPERLRRYITNLRQQVEHLEKIREQERGLAEIGTPEGSDGGDTS